MPINNNLYPESTGESYTWTSSETCYKPVTKPPCYKSKCIDCQYKDTCANYKTDINIPYTVTYSNNNRPANESGFT